MYTNLSLSSILIDHRVIIPFMIIPIYIICPSRNKHLEKTPKPMVRLKLVLIESFNHLSRHVVEMPDLTI